MKPKADDFLIDPVYAQRWAFLLALNIPFMNWGPEGAPTEEFLVRENGDLVMFVDVPRYKRFSVRVPAGEWQWRQ